MSKEFRDGLSRELRYMEYKLRKNRSSKGADKKKNKQNQFGKYPTMDDYSSSSAAIPSEFKDALPSSSGEADLQLQVALALSREEASENEKAQDRDRVKLEMALKESATIGAKVVEKVSPTRTAAADPWGGPTQNSATAPQNAFDPFSAPDSQMTQSNGFGSDAWGVPSSNSGIVAAPQAQAPAAAPWNPPKQAAVVLPPPQKTIGKPLDPWGPSSSQSKPAPQPDPWNNAQPVTSQAPNAGAWDAQPAPQSTPFCQDNAFGFSANSSPAVNSNTLYDPMNDFDSLHISSASPVAPQHQPLMDDLLGGANVMVPVQSNGNGNLASPAHSTDLNDNQLKDMNAGTQKADAFLGENAALVNMDNLVTKPKVVNPYQTLSTGSTGMLGANRNPFNQKGPSKSLNEIKGGLQPGFQQQMPVAQSTIMAPMNQPQMGFGMPVAASTQPAFGTASNPFGQPVGQPNAFPQQNQSLF